MILKTTGAATILVMSLACSGAKKDLDAGSTWEVVETTSLKSLTIAEGCTITAPEGFKVSMTVDGAAKAIKAGTYKGNILLTVTKS